MRRAHPYASFAALLMAVATSACADVDAITITRASGTVKIVVDGTPVAARVGAHLGLPARIETGVDGSLRIEQASSNLDIGPSSVIVLPERTAGGNTEKIMQNLGRVLYSVKPRKTRSFAVETPYLVSVVKGTVFSVAVENDATAVSLLEGSVELVADGIEPVLLHPNESARRGLNERAIGVTKIDVTPPPAPPQASASTVKISTETPVAAPATIDAAIASDLNAITAVRHEQRTPATVAPNPIPNAPIPDSTPTVPGTTPDIPTTPSTPSTPTPSVPSDPAPQAPETVPTTPDTDLGDSDDQDDQVCFRKKCDSDDDDDRGRGNDDRKTN